MQSHLARQPQPQGPATTIGDEKNGWDLVGGNLWVGPCFFWGGGGTLHPQVGGPAVLQVLIIIKTEYSDLEIYHQKILQVG